jgi:ABC-2 type transport system ATP-binding protein
MAAIDSSHPLVVAGAEKTFGKVRALSGASIDVRKGELVGLLGPNGAGKTSLIKAIAGRLTLDAGTITLFGRTLARTDPRPEIGVVPQELALYPLLTARENLEVFGALYGVTGATLEARVAWALEWADLADRANEPTKKFSGGMKRRLNIACSLLHLPSLVLLDEPTVGVDPQSRERIYEMLAGLRQSGTSIVLTTHHLEEAEQRCERIVIIDHGRIVASGTLADLLGTVLGGSRTLEIELGRPLNRTEVKPSDVRVEGSDVVGVRLTGATLRDVFIKLTGRELRE